MKKPIIIINGSGGVGKDSFIDFCREYADITNISSVDKVKEAALILGWDGGKIEKDRLFLSNLKLLSTGYNNNPYEYVKESICNFKEHKSLSKVMFIHIRESEEINKIKNTFGCRTLLVKNANKPKITSNMADANVENYTYDYVIDNNQDLDSLKQQAEDFILKLFESHDKHIL